jgi:hypothetical protein
MWLYDTSYEEFVNLSLPSLFPTYLASAKVHHVSQAMALSRARYPNHLASHCVEPSNISHVKDFCHVIRLLWHAVSGSTSVPAKSIRHYMNTHNRPKRRSQCNYYGARTECLCLPDSVVQYLTRSDSSLMVALCYSQNFRSGCTGQN